MRNKILLSTLLISISIISCTSTKNVPDLAPTQYPLANNLLWKVHRNGQNDTSFLFGTFHLMCKEDIEFKNQIIKAIGKSSDIYLEMKLDDPAMMMKMLTMVNMKDNKSLSDYLSAAEFAKVESFFKDSLAIPINFLKTMQPIVLSSLIYPKFMNCRQNSGIEQEIMLLAKKYNKEIKGLETLEFQASLFDSIPYDQQARSLYKTIDSFPKYKAEFLKMYNNYREENLEQLGKMLNQSNEEMGEKLHLFLDKRNIDWVKQLKDIFTYQSVFVAVGAGHLIGENGLIYLFRKEGYVVEPVN